MDIEPVTDWDTYYAKQYEEKLNERKKAAHKVILNATNRTVAKNNCRYDVDRESVDNPEFRYPILREYSRFFNDVPINDVRKGTYFKMETKLQYYQDMHQGKTITKFVEEGMPDVIEIHRNDLAHRIKGHSLDFNGETYLDELTDNDEQKKIKSVLDWIIYYRVWRDFDNYLNELNPSKVIPAMLDRVPKRVSTPKKHETHDQHKKIAAAVV